MATIPTVTDRNVQYPNRVTLTPVSEGVYDVTATPGNVTAAGTAINKALLDQYAVNTQTTGSNAKTTPIDADTMPLVDSAESGVLKKVTWANIKATLVTLFDARYKSLGGVHPTDVVGASLTADTYYDISGGALTAFTPSVNCTVFMMAQCSIDGGTDTTFQLAVRNGTTVLLNNMAWVPAAGGRIPLTAVGSYNLTAGTTYTLKLSVMSNNVNNTTNIEDPELAAHVLPR